MDQVHELEVFSAFASAANFELADGSTVSTDPPEPDVLCTINGERQYFEIGEIMWEPPDSPGATLAKLRVSMRRRAAFRLGAEWDGAS